MTIEDNYAKVRIYSMIRGSIFDIRYSNIEPYRISNLIEPLGYSIDRTIEYRTIEPYRISNLIEPLRYSIDRTIEYRTIEPHRISNLFQPANIRSIEPSNIEYRTSNSNIHRMVR